MLRKDGGEGKAEVPPAPSRRVTAFSDSREEAIRAKSLARQWGMDRILSLTAFNYRSRLPKPKKWKREEIGWSPKEGQIDLHTSALKAVENQV